MRPLSIGVVLLAAGASSRMGQPKMLLPWGGTSVVGHLIALWQSLGAAQIAVVCGVHSAPLQKELNCLGFSEQNRIINLTPEAGMFSSIRCAARWPRWNTELSHWAIVLGDQPHLRKDTLHSLLAFATNHPDRICQPSFRGRRRHPVILPKEFFRALATCTATHLKEYLQQASQPVVTCEVDDMGLDIDIDTPEDYERARELFLRQPETRNP
jgi:molybdenum cofactor cytidylyltransferase